ncbi:MAG TPA: hypothetical protein PK014_12340, partial [Thermoanaerobaculia bacterium]|nr:hypothetical protein [Thermoanaerobaculia bacterium]HUM30830.1 hypothetical protein [Thermoanaerobaculia bacterium]HXK69189.1 hypothetical protein [Thermoanaerobaculia bacterium]
MLAYFLGISDWEKLDAGEGPPIYENSGDSFLDFHLAYDPMMEKLVLTYYNEETSMSDTWLFDGFNWTYDCTHLAMRYPQKVWKKRKAACILR